MNRCNCSWCDGVDFGTYCRNCEHGVAFMEIHSRGPSWDGICSGCHMAERKALEDRKPLKHLYGINNGVSFEYHEGTTIVLGRDEDNEV